MFVFAELFVFFGTLSFLVGLWFYHRQKNYEKLLAMHGIPLAGSNAINLLFNGVRIHENDVKIYHEIKVEKGKKFGVVMEVTWPGYFITDLDLLKAILVRDFDHFTSRRRFYFEKNDPHIHFALANTEGEQWKNLRAKATTAFTTSRLRRVFPILQFSSQKLVEAFKNHHDDEVDIVTFVQRVTIDIIARVAFGWETDIFTEPSSQLEVMGKKVGDFFEIKTVAAMLTTHVFGPRLSALLNIKVLKKDANKYFTNIIFQTLKNRERTGEVRDDFLQTMIEARKKNQATKEAAEVDTKFESGTGTGKTFPITDDVIMGQSFPLLFGGINIMEGALVYSLLPLAMNPQVQEKLFQELEQIRSNSETGEFDYDSIQNAEYLNMVISESLRMYPPSIRTERRCVKPYKMPDSNFILPKDSIVAIPTYAIHRDPEIWPEPEKFNPLRFTKEQVAKRHSAAYQPFGIGPRMCTASRLTLIECKVVIAHIILNLKLEPCAKTENPPVFAKYALLKPNNGMWLKVTPRSG